ncbi:S8 family serine peptidase [Nonomuraea sp. NPDC050783]|uniref:S8 family peptidase n=1 Tax=Nonomuraea sp. NPDC050783 TaxID=3154634 RepID=UPI003465F7AC
MRVLIQLRPATDVVASVLDPRVASTVADVVSDLPGVSLDAAFGPVAVPRARPSAAHGGALSLSPRVEFSLSPEHASVLVRGEIPDAELSTRLSRLQSAVPEVTGIFADPFIQPSGPTCGGDGPVGDWHDVRRLLHASELWEEGHDGEGVAVAVCDTGINAAHVRSALGEDVEVDAGRSWAPPGVPKRPGAYPVNHGTMCAFDVLLAAPKATLLDIPILLSQQGSVQGLLSDAVAAYSHLRGVLNAMSEEHRALVVSNSWGLFSPLGDLPPGHPGNYSDNPSHPFNLIVGSLADAGADVVFAAGNCGRDCPDQRCGFRERPIVGANGHPDVLSVGGVDTRRERVGYSSQGPARLADRKPDLCSYTHFAGSGAVGEADTGTSAACPTAAGVVAAVRTRRTAVQLSPEQLRTQLNRTADDRSTVGYDYDYGWGIIDPPAVLAALGRARGERAA